MADNYSDRSRLTYLFTTYLRPYWRSCLLLLLSYFLVTVLTALQPLMMAPILDVALGRQVDIQAASPAPDWSTLDLNNIGQYLMQQLRLDVLDPWHVVLYLALVYLGISVLLHLLTFANYLLALWIRVRAGRDMQQDLFRHILSLSLDFFHRQRTGELISRLDKDTTATVSGLEPAARSLIVSSLLVLIYGSLLVRTNLRLTVLILLAGGLHYGLTQAIRNPIRRRVRDQFNIMADTTAYLQEIVLSIRVIKSFAAERYELSRLREVIARLVHINMRYGVFKHVHEPAGAIISATINVAILLFAIRELFSGRLTTSGFFLYLYVGRSVVDPISALGQTYTQIQQTLAAGERVRELFAEQPLVKDGPERVDAFRRAIELENVSFRYDSEEVLKNINLRIGQGEIVALVGPSGAGKSTLTDLTLRFYDPQSGRITIDGHDLRDLELASYRRLFGVVAQESLLFNATVAENIAYCCEDEGLTRAEIENAARIANAHEFIMQLPQGYDTLVGDRGVRLSGGQRQRVAIARAVVRKPQILILDEATSSLDSESERLVQEAIDRVIQNMTAIVIAHRLSTVLRADKIVVLNNERIEAIGRHDELLQTSPTYEKLYRLQFEGGEAQREGVV